MGEDSWLGTYFGAELHGGLDVNMPSNTPIIAPIDFDEHYFFNSLKAGDNNNRWRGVRYWENGDIWYLQTHHINELVVPQYIPLKQGDVFAHGAGTWCGYSPHSHFVFNTYQPEFDNWILMDPWVILWQIFENNRRKANAIIAAIEPLAPVHTGEQVHFSSKGSRPSIYGGEFEFFWDFGDGYTSFAENPMHVYLEPGIYPVTFTVRNGYSTDSYTQHITVNGKAVTVTSLSFTSEQEPSFRRRPAWKTSAYGTCLDIVNTVIFRSYQDSKEEPAAKTISIWFNKSADQDNTNNVDDLYAKPQAILPVYRYGDDWLEIERIPSKDHVDLKIRPIMENVIVKWGYYEAFIMIGDDETVNSPQYIRVLLDICYDRPQPSVIVDNLDMACTRSDYFWLSLTQHSSISSGYNGNYCISGGNRKGEFIRYTPNLEEGSYEVSLYGKAYENQKLMSKTGSFEVTVHHAGGIDRIRVNPTVSLSLGEYQFTEGRDGYVEIHSGSSEGLVVADAVKFEKKK
jgi:PKD repeat protein